ncbi:MAG: von Willebrand factor type A domain-containing protein [Candidatus Tectomicrobia bacterium]
MGRVLDAMDKAGNPLNIVILDACRDNLFTQSWRRTRRTQERGLAAVQAMGGALIAYATAPGSVVAEGKGRNSLYTEHLLRYMTVPGQSIEWMFKQVRLGVMKTTRGKQTPWEVSSLTADFAFVPQRVSSPPAVRDLPMAHLKLAPQAIMRGALAESPAPMRMAPPAPPFNTEGYRKIDDNPFLTVANNPLSTFSIDVDTASYSNTRRFINQGQLPPKDAVRIEELINYFQYDYDEPDNDDPFSIVVEQSVAPWNPEHRLVHIGLQGKRIPQDELPPSNWVFLIDVSGSMRRPNKLPLLKSAFTLLVAQMDADDRISIVVYAGAAGLVLPPTPGDHKATILQSLAKLRAGGSTAGSAGIRLAYEMAKKHFIPSGNNRVVLATDGDFNVGVSSEAELVRLIEQERESGVFLTVLGFGSGNYQDAKMEQLANKGNGNYAYIDNLMEAQKALVKEMGGTFFTIAKDVKIQVEFNPVHVQAYRLIGYENRLLRNEDFNDDTKDAGEIGAGHTVTALYEIIPPTAQTTAPSVDPLKYQTTQVKPEAYDSDEMITVKVRYKAPSGDTSQLIERVITHRAQTLERTSDDFRFSAAVAQYGMLMRDSEQKGAASFESVLQLAKEAKGKDDDGYRAEFIRMVEMTHLLVSAKKY